MNEQRVCEAFVQAIRAASTHLPSDVVRALEHVRDGEASSLAVTQLDTLLENEKIARSAGVPLCQDTGLLTFFVTAGAKSPYLRFVKRWITTAIVRATDEVPLRPNTVDPLTGRNSGDNLGRSMPLITWEVTDGDSIDVTLVPKGGGSENMSALHMLSPSAGWKGVKRTVVEQIASSAGRACPPIVVGVGVGGGADFAMLLAKRAILREIGSAHPEPAIAALERELLRLANRTGVGAMGVGGTTTCLAVHIDVAARHPASFPVGILMQCWADRRSRVRILADGTVEAIPA